MSIKYYSSYIKMHTLPDLGQFSNFALAALLIFAIVIGRYFIVSACFHFYFFHWKKDSWQSKKIHTQPYTNQQFIVEVKWSVISAGIFGIVGAATLLLWQRGFTSIYLHIDDYGIVYLPVSLMLSLFIQETYYYWLHRWMHIPQVFKILHRVHHQSRIPSVWTAFSFHPAEGFLQGIILPIILLFIPLHPAVIIFQLIFMSLTSVINHLDIEIYPPQFQKNKFLKWLIGASHHSMHHKRYKYNFGLYFTFWDKIAKTEKLQE